MEWDINTIWNNTPIEIEEVETDDFNFSVQTSANMTTNPRTEQACIQISDESYSFFYDYLSGIKSFI